MVFKYFLNVRVMDSNYDILRIDYIVTYIRKHTQKVIKCVYCNYMY